MTETREPAETGGYASLEEDDEDLSPGPEHSSDSEYTLSEPDSEEDEEEEEEEEETTDDPEYDPGYKVKQRLGGGGGPSRRAPRAAQLPGPPAQPCQLCGRSPLGEAPPGTPPCRLCGPATAPQEAPAPDSRALGEEAEEPRAGEGRPTGREEEEEEEEEEGTYHCTECEDSFDNLGELHGHFMLHARGEV
uniref:C2H2-type domain-containing protein n=1 Tax=Sus scrofa TaxID=9823 RepID=A0A4X1W3C4_PIG